MATPPRRTIEIAASGFWLSILMIVPSTRLAISRKNWVLSFPVPLRYPSIGLDEQYYRPLLAVFDHDRLIEVDTELILRPSTLS